MEEYHRHVPPPPGHTMSSDYIILELAQTYNDGYDTVDWNSPLRNGKRYFGEELERSVQKWHGNLSDEQQKHFTENSLMRAAQLGINYIWTSRDFINASFKMFVWWTLTAGKGPKNSPDDVCWLREDYYSKQNKVVSWKNFEKLLYQRDFNGANTKPVMKIERPPFHSDPEEMHYDHYARSTDVEDGQNYILFFIDPLFKANLSDHFLIKVTYTKKWKTATFEVSGNISNKTLPHKDDFRLRVVSGGDLIVKFVRIIKLYSAWFYQAAPLL